MIQRTETLVGSVCLIPCFSRPEFLKLCLERIQEADYWSELHYVFAIDFGYNREILNVIREFPAIKKHLYFTERNSFGIMKQSSNVLNGYIMAARIAGDALVFMIEEDVMVGTDFFELHRLIHQQREDIFCSIGTRNNNRKVQTTNDVEAYYLTTQDYQSLGVCYKASVIKQYIEPHYNSDYMRNPQMYCMRKFTGSIVGSGYVEQDGLIRRIQERLNMETGINGIAFPHVPRAFHAGYYGKNRGNRIGGSFKERLEIIRSVIFDDNKMRHVNRSNLALYEDSKPVNLCFNELKQVKNIQHI